MEEEIIISNEFTNNNSNIDINILITQAKNQLDERTYLYSNFNREYIEEA